MGGVVWHTQDEETELLALERAGWQTLWDAEEEDF
eukprot:COSAG01_NODE_29969_length_626_cov_0.662239_1_plen_34_part_10